MKTLFVVAGLVGVAIIACTSSGKPSEDTASPTVRSEATRPASPTPALRTPCPSPTPCAECPQPTPCPDCPSCPEPSSAPENTPCPACPEPVTCPVCPGPVVCPQHTPCPGCPGPSLETCNSVYPCLACPPTTAPDLDEVCGLIDDLVNDNQTLQSAWGFLTVALMFSKDIQQTDWWDTDNAASDVDRAVSSLHSWAMRHC